MNLFFVMKNNIIWSVFSIASFFSAVKCSPVAESGHTNTSNGYKLEIISKNDPNSGAINSKGFLDKLDFSALYNTVVKDVVPVLLQTHEKGSPPGKETKHQLSTSITESLTKNLSDAFNSKLGQEIMIAAGIKKRPTLLETIYLTIAEYIKWMGTLASNKIHEIKQKGVVRTFSDTFSGVFWSNGHITSPHETHKPIPATPKTNSQHQTEAVMQTRGLGLIHEIIDAASSRRDGYGRPPHRPGFGPGPWNSFFYQPYDRYNPYSSLPPFMGGGPIAYVGYLLSSVFYFIQEFFYRLFSHGPGAYPPPRGRPSLFRPPGRPPY